MGPFLVAACSVLEEVSGSEVKRGSLNLLGARFPTAAVNIAARVDGSLAGGVVYSMTGLTAQELASRLTGRQCGRFDRVVGMGLGQLGVMFADATGRVLAQHGYSCRISGPTVFQGLNVEFSAEAPALCTPIETAAGAVDVNVAVKDDE